MSRASKLWVILFILLIVWLIAGGLGGMLVPDALVSHIWLWAIGCLVMLLLLIKLRGRGDISAVSLVLALTWYSTEMLIWIAEGKQSERMWVAFLLFSGTTIWHTKVIARKASR